MDVVVIKDTSSPFFDRLQEVSSLLPAEIGVLDILVYTPEEFSRLFCRLTNDKRVEISGSLSLYTPIHIYRLISLKPIIEKVQSFDLTQY